MSLIQLFVLIQIQCILDTLLRITFNPTISLIINVPPGKRMTFQMFQKVFFNNYL